MDANIRQQDVFHRRGLLLGLTMAEIMILILFCLLLLFGVQKIFFEKEIERRDATILSAIKDGKIEPALVEAIPILVRQKPADRTYNDYFSELVRAGQEMDKEKAQREKLSKELVQAKGDLATSQRLNMELEQQLAKAQAELASANEKLASAKIPSDDTLADARSFQEVAKEFPTNTPREDIVSWVKKAKEDEKKYASLEPQLSACEQQKDTLLSQNAAIRRKCIGSEKPSCWYDEAGYEDLIFDVALTSSGLVLVDRKLPRRVTDQAKLPISEIVFGKELTDDAFRSQAKPLFDWSESHDCQFFVRVFDFTKPHEKEVYKRRLSVLEERFYSRKKEREKNYEFPLQEASWTERPSPSTGPQRTEPAVPADTRKATGAVSPNKPVAPATTRSTSPDKTTPQQKQAGDAAQPSDHTVPTPPAKDTGNPLQIILDFLKSGTSQ